MSTIIRMVVQYLESLSGYVLSSLYAWLRTAWTSVASWLSGLLGGSISSWWVVAVAAVPALIMYGIDYVTDALLLVAADLFADAMADIGPPPMAMELTGMMAWMLDCLRFGDVLDLAISFVLVKVSLRMIPFIRIVN